MRKNVHLMVMIVACATFIITSCRKDGNDVPTPSAATSNAPDISEKGANPDEIAVNDNARTSSMSGYLYTQSNHTINQIVCYRQNSDGSLTFKDYYATGGMGTATPLGSQGALAMSQDRKWLFAVNAGNQSITSFMLSADGSLKRADTENSVGQKPVSLCTYGNYVYAVNATSSNITGFRVAPTGELTYIPGSMQSLSGPGVVPAQISFSPNGSYLYVTEKMSNKISVFPVNSNGVAGPGTFIASTGVTPFGFSCARDQYLVVSNATMNTSNAGTCTSYDGIASGNPGPVNSTVANGQTAPCWVTTTYFGRYAFVTNTFSGTISSYYVGPSGNLYLINGSAASGSGPIDICVAENNYYVYVINSLNHTIGWMRRGFLGSLHSIGQTTNVTAHASGLVSYYP